MDKWILGIVVVAIVAVFIVPAAAQNGNEVYLVPQDSNATFCNTADVELWVNATEFQSGQINLTYDPACANVTNWVRNTTNFQMGGWEHYDGSVWINFVAMANLTGNYMVGTLTIHCVNASEGGCETQLAFDMSDPFHYCALFDADGYETPAAWVNGTFSCTHAPAQSYVVSSDDLGNEKNSFNPDTDDVYCYAGNLPYNKMVKIYVVENKDNWVVGNTLTDKSTDGVENVTTNVSGGIWPPVKIWQSSLDVGEYDIVVDVNKSGTWDAGEPIDSRITMGFDVIPEFSTIVIPVAAIIGLFLLMRRRK